MTTEQSPPNRVSDKDREYFRRLGEWEAQNERDDWARCQAMTIAERLQLSWAVTRSHRTWLARWPDELPEEDILTRAKRLGLYRHH